MPWNGAIGVVALALLTAACGGNEQQRAASGEWSGAGVGAGAGTAMPEGTDRIAQNVIQKEQRATRTALNDAGVSGLSRTDWKSARRS
jgi:hypothetical protein